MAKLLPQSVQRIASLFDATPVSSGLTVVARPLAGPRSAPSAPLIAYDLGSARRPMKCVGVGLNVLEVESPEWIAEHTLMSLELDLKPPLSLWAAVTAVKRTETSHRVELTPFGMSEEAYRRYATLCSASAAAAHEARPR